MRPKRSRSNAAIAEPLDAETLSRPKRRRVEQKRKDGEVAFECVPQSGERLRRKSVSFSDIPTLLATPRKKQATTRKPRHNPPPKSILRPCIAPRLREDNFTPILPPPDFFQHSTAATTITAMHSQPHPPSRYLASQSRSQRLQLADTNVQRKQHHDVQQDQPVTVECLANSQTSKPLLVPAHAPNSSRRGDIRFLVEYASTLKEIEAGEDVKDASQSSYPPFALLQTPSTLSCIDQSPTYFWSARFSTTASSTISDTRTSAYAWAAPPFSDSTQPFARSILVRKSTSGLMDAVLPTAVAFPAHEVEGKL